MVRNWVLLVLLDFVFLRAHFYVLSFVLLLYFFCTSFVLLLYFFSGTQMNRVLNALLQCNTIQVLYIQNVANGMHDEQLRYGHYLQLMALPQLCSHFYFV